MPDTKITAFAPPDDTAAPFVRVLHLPPGPSSDEVFERGREWIKTCCSSHKQCKVVGREGLSLLPTRVIDVGMIGDEGNASAVRLHISADGEHGEYACLSYCWGGDQFKLTSENLGKLEVEVPTTALSLTVADAVEVTRRLGLRYLWVDALCILQDNDQDKAREITQMGAIYKNSTITIAAATARAANEGFLRTPRIPPPSAVVKIPLPNGDVGPVHLTLEAFVEQGSQRSMKYHPLDGRGWCLQEYLLSPRLLYFSKWNVEWQCQHGDVLFVYDDLFGEKRTTSRTFRLPPGLFGTATAGDLWRKMDKGLMEPMYNDRYTLWQRVVEDYSTRSLTFANDKLPALAGISAELQQLWKDEYMFGMWRKLLPRMLAWGVRGKEGGQRIAGVPSWSWASVSAPVTVTKMRQPQITNFALEETSVHEKLGGISGSRVPRLEVTGTLIKSPGDLRKMLVEGKDDLQVRLDLDEPADPLSWSYLVVDSFTWYEPVGYTPMKCYEATYLLLREVEDGVYERVGVALYKLKRKMSSEKDTPWFKMSKAKPTAGIKLV
ncbi:hypothetical protein VTK26DRAFT_526 [Humicola hyalothermophila]